MKKFLRKVAPYLMLALLVVPSLAFAQIDPGLDILEGPLGLESQDVRVTIANIINVALGLLGIVAVVIVIYAGFLWMTAGGNQTKVDDAKKWLAGGIIGLVLILSAYAIASFIVNSLLTATSGV